MKAFAFHSAALRRIASFACDRRGVSAVEFAMVLPLMVTLYLGVVEVSQGVAIDRKVTLTTRTVADLASQVASINNTEMSNLLNATAAVIAPYEQSKLKVTVSAVSVDANAVIMNATTSRFRSLAVRSTSTPLRSGMRMSDRSRSTGSRCSCSIASLPFSATRTS